ncbi:PREDICTED: serine/threonine-protein kinase 24-like [Branchiostoma belcheri]|uniref:non-specific serine/threonine protein kinase n=1 Tax=Branchiostoma belcheri TaxID=7741 RepID=A0A6P4ZX55_BRABE|nr:PREDICTED: serine/threonine-protein kinase 24-like [Branchiostoma belcheri]
MTLTKLGEGSEGEVYIAIDLKDKNLFAVKKVSLQKFGKTNPAAFLQLTDCPQVCKPFGLILDEEGECVYFLMERLRGKTLKLLLNSGDEIPITTAVGICIEIMKALSYIHSKGMVHRDVKEDNVMSKGTNATVLDITGVRKADKYSQFAQDTVMAVNLLNEMLLPPDSRSEGAVWTPSDEDQKKYPKEALQDLKKIMEIQMKAVPSMDHATVEKLLEDLQSISRRLSGATNVAQYQGATCSSSDADPAQGMTQQGSTSSSFDSKGIPSPFFDKDELMKKMEALQAEKDNCSRELVEAQKKIKDQEEQMQQMEKEHKDDFTRVNKKRMELKLKVKLLQDERLMTELENLKWKAQAQHLEVENQEMMMELDMLLLKDKKLKDELDALKAKMKKMQDEDARAEE